MNSLFASWLIGRFTWSAFPHNPITAGGAIGMVLILLAIIAGITYFKKWPYLWREWLTSQDPKRIGVMYIVVSLVMLLRGFSDVIMLRFQQASDGHVISASLFQQVVSQLC